MPVDLARAETIALEMRARAGDMPPETGRLLSRGYHTIVQLLDEIRRLQEAEKEAPDAP